MSVRLVGAFLVLLTAWGLYGLFVLVLNGVSARFLVGRVALTAVTAVGAWLLLRGTAWGYLLGLGVGFYWLCQAAKMYSWLAGRHEDITYTIAMVVFLAFGGLVLAGLLTPHALRWFAASRVDGSQAPTGD